MELHRVLREGILTEPHEDELEGEPRAVDDVVLPAKLLEGDGVDVLVEDEREGDGKVEGDEALGTEVVGQNLDGVRDNERGVGDTIEKLD